MNAPFDLAPSTALLEVGAQLQQAAYNFTTITPASHARVLARPGATWGTTLADVFGWSKPFVPATLAPALLEAMREACIIIDEDDDDLGMRSCLRASTLDGNLFFHSSFPTRAADSVFFGPDTYRFVRALHAVLARRTAVVERAVDIGCGSGAAAVALALHYPHAHVIASDINRQALRLTQVNAHMAGASNLTVAYSDLLDHLDGNFDLITANPPYLLDPDQRAYRHGGGNLGEGLSLDIVRAAITRLNPGGELLLYTGVAIVDGHDAFRSNATALLRHAGIRFHYSEIDPDVFGEELAQSAYASADRIAAVVLHATRG
ncbi:MAG TPA: class I SAM-dependent methyltransferase [Telluria sp.]|jgi:methylase of polypeptide subunit release factors